MKKANFDSGPIISPLRERSCLEEKGRRHTYHELIVLSERFQCLQQFLSRHLGREVGHKYNPRRAAVHILVLPKHDDLLPQHAKRLLGICMQGARNAVYVRKTTSARLPSGCTNIRATLPKRWKTEGMSVVMVLVVDLLCDGHYR